MGDRELVVDTSVFIDFLRKRNKQNTHLWKLKERNFNCLISTISVFELYAGAVTERHNDDLDRLLKWMTVVPFSRNMAKMSGEIYRILKAKNQLIEFRDIFIGATSLKLSTPLFTLNEKHFVRIEGIELFTASWLDL